jgi:hypothetical protein
MTTFAEAVKSTPAVARTENGMKAKAHSGNALVDLFYKIGASRGKSVTADFEMAFQEDRDLAMKIALWSRDIRGGAGERQIFRDILVHLEKLHPDVLEAVLPFVSEFGRWDDLLVFKTEKFKHMAYTLIGDALRERNGLCAKWMPRQGPIAVEIRNFYGMTPKFYRKSLVALTNVVESKMCAKDWNSIEFGKLPSLASARYNKAFAKNASAAYNAYKARLTAGTDKVNASAVYPYDVIKTLRHGGDGVVADAQWASLPNYIGDASVMPLVDVSGSMCCPVGGNANLQCIDVALSLGLYCADKNTGVFKDTFLTFSDKPKAQVVKGSLSQKMAQMNSSDWGMNTNLHAAFDEILRIAVKGGVNASDMPKTLLILSDMQFDRCVSFDDSAHQMIKRKYKDAGYDVPNVVFWNLNSKDNVPVKFDKRGTALVSGFSPAVMKGILSGADMTPYGIMLATVDIDRYSVL